MSFTYLGTLATDLDKVRFHVQDTEYDAGPKPADANFTNEEINGLITTEGTWQRAVAGLFETLAATWGRHVTFNADGVSVSQSDVARYYSEQGKLWRKKWGNASGSTGSFGSSTVIRKDGYSDSYDNVEQVDDGIETIVDLLT